MFDHLKMGGIIQHIKTIWLVYDIALLTLVILNIRLPSVVRFIKRGWLENPRTHELWFGFVGRIMANHRSKFGGFSSQPCLMNVEGTVYHHRGLINVQHKKFSIYT